VKLDYISDDTRRPILGSLKRRSPQENLRVHVAHSAVRLALPNFVMPLSMGESILTAITILALSLVFRRSAPRPTLLQRLISWMRSRKNERAMTNSYRPIKGSTVAATVPLEYLKKSCGLVVGQKVRMASGPYGCEGRVVDVSPSGVVEVQTGVMQNDGTWNAHERLHFDNNGNGRDAEGTIECGPWYIVRGQ